MPYNNFSTWKSVPISERPYLSIVVPTYNEEWRILPTIGAIASHVSDLGFPWELIVSDDGSSDQTVSLVTSLDMANLKLIEGEHRGKGAAVRAGMLSARGRYVLFADSDNSTPIEEVTRFLRALSEEGYDVAVGSRVAAGAREVNRSALRLFTSGALRRLARWVLHLPVDDTQCGFKMFTHDAAQNIFGAQTLNGFSFDLEVLHLACRWGYRVTELPVAWVEAPGSKVRPLRESWRFLRDIVRIKRNDFFRVYPHEARLKKRTIMEDPA